MTCFFTLDEQDLLRAEIARLDQAICSAGKDPLIRQRWGLSGRHLALRLGSDNECYAFHREADAKIGSAQLDRFKEEHPPLRPTAGLLNTVRETCQKDLCKRPKCESQALELNLKASKPLKLVERHLSLGAQVKSLADSLGWDFAMGAGHWHLSLADREPDGTPRHLMNRFKEKTLHVAFTNWNGDQYRTDFGYSDLARVTAYNLVVLSRHCPALFFRPSRCEKKEAKHTKKVGIDYGETRDYTLQLNGDTYPNGASFFEMRMANLAPYTPILMMEHALLLSLQGKKLRPSDEEGRLQLRDVFVRGPGCFETYIDQTQRSRHLDVYFPQLKPILLAACVRSYETFLATPSWSASLYASHVLPRHRENIAKKYARLRRKEQTLAA